VPCSNFDGTALQCAIYTGSADVADYLRSIGARE
jgi:hypothetical protein